MRIDLTPIVILALIIAAIGGLAWAAMAGLPTYHIWRAEQDGAAELARANQNRRIAVLEAEARLESERLNAQAEIARAEGVAAANEIVAEGLGGPEGYLRYLWISSLNENRQNVVYVPTEAGLPILEAGRIAQQRPLTQQ